MDIYFATWSVPPVILQLLVPNLLTSGQCLVEWFHHKKSCPECRAAVNRQPANAYLVNIGLLEVARSSNIYVLDYRFEI